MIRRIITVMVLWSAFLMGVWFTFRIDLTHDYQWGFKVLTLSALPAILMTFAFRVRNPSIYFILASALRVFSPLLVLTVLWSYDSFTVAHFIKSVTCIQGALIFALPMLYIFEGCANLIPRGASSVKNELTEFFSTTVFLMLALFSLSYGFEFAAFVIASVACRKTILDYVFDRVI